MFERKLKQELERVQAELARAKRLGAGLAHELRAPLQNIIALTELINSNPGEKEKNDLLRTLTQSSKDLFDTFTTLLEVYSSEDKSREPKSESFCLQQLINNCFYQTQERINKKSLFFASFISPDLPQLVSGERIKIRQILLNLISNASKFTQNGLILVRFYPLLPIQKGEQAGIQVACEVIDTGPGICENSRESIFEAFNRGCGEATRQEGKGLGLALCKDLAESIGAKLELKSSDHTGSVFSLSLSLGLPEERSYFNKNFYKSLRMIAGVQEPLFAKHLEGFFSELGCPFAQLQDSAATKNLVSSSNFGPICIIADYSVSVDPSLLALLDGMDKQPVILCLPETLLLGPMPLKNPRSHWIYLPFRSPFMGQHFLQALAALLCGLEVQEQKQGQKKADIQEILLVDDNAINQLVGRKMIEKCGYKALVADSSSTAIASFECSQPALIFMDFHLPEMSGVATAKIIRGIESAKQLKPTPIIGLSADAHMQNKKDWQENMNDFVVKPVSLEQIQNTIKRWLVN